MFCFNIIDFNFVFVFSSDNDILKGIPIKTIDASQGQEDDIVLISIGRTSGSGFLVSPQRVNVAMTRAKKCLILFCNFRAVKVE